MVGNTGGEDFRFFKLRAQEVEAVGILVEVITWVKDKAERRSSCAILRVTRVSGDKWV